MSQNSVIRAIVLSLGYLYHTLHTPSPRLVNVGRIRGKCQRDRRTELCRIKLAFGSEGKCNSFCLGSSKDRTTLEDEFGITQRASQPENIKSGGMLYSFRGRL